MEKEYLIKKWLADELTEGEKKTFESLDEHAFYNEIIEMAPQFKASHFSEVPEFEALEARIGQTPKVRRLHWPATLLRMTGVFVIGLGIYFLFFFNQLTTIETLASEKTTIELPDASAVTLNALTEISYNKRKWDQNRVVNLEGEAFFKVAKGKVFDVVTDDGIVTVVGTEFNVKQRDNFFEVKCFEGIVSVAADNFSKELLAGDTFRMYNKKVSYATTSNRTPVWTRDESAFQSVPFHEVIDELERQFNVQVNYDATLGEQLFTGGFVHNNLDNALKSITAPLELTYVMQSSNQVRLKKSGAN